MWYQMFTCSYLIQYTLSNPYSCASSFISDFCVKEFNIFRRSFLLITDPVNSAPMFISSGFGLTGTGWNKDSGKFELLSFFLPLHG